MRAQDRAKEWKSQKQWFDSLSIEELYGDIVLADDPPLLFIRCTVKYSSRIASIVKARMKFYARGHFLVEVDTRNRGYLIIKGQVHEVYGILQKMEDIPYEIVGKSLVYDGNRKHRATQRYIRDMNRAEQSSY